MKRALLVNLALVSSSAFVTAAACSSSSNDTSGESDAGSVVDCAASVALFPKHCACAPLASDCTGSDAGPLCENDFADAFASVCGHTGVGSYERTTSSCGGYTAIELFEKDTARYFFYDAESGALRGDLYVVNGASSLCYGDVPDPSCLDSWEFLFGCNAADASKFP